MARNVTRRIQGTEEQDGQQEAPAQAAEVPQRAAGQGGVLPREMRPRGETTPEQPVIRPREFEVLNGPRMVMYGGTQTMLRAGKVLSEASCNIDHLRRQGVQLRENLQAAEPVACRDVEPVQATVGESA